MDASLPPGQLAGIRDAPENICAEGVSYRNLKTRMGGSLVFITLDVIVPEHWSVRQGRDWRERIESRLKETRAPRTGRHPPRTLRESIGGKAAARSGALGRSV